MKLSIVSVNDTFVLVIEKDEIIKKKLLHVAKNSFLYFWRHYNPFET